MVAGQHAKVVRALGPWSLITRVEHLGCESVSLTPDLGDLNGLL